MTKPPMLEKIANYSFNHFTKNWGNFLLISGCIGWAASCVNQLVAISLNKKIPKKQKYFLFPQEITDGIVNVALFALFTRSCTRIGERLVESGRLLTPTLKKGLEKYADKVGKSNFDIGRDVSEINPLSPKNIYDKGLDDHYNNFLGGISFAFSTLGSVISCDFITPFVRNKVASHRQKMALEKDKGKEDFKLNDVTNNVVLAQNKLSIDDYRRQASVIPLRSSSSMKI